MKRIVALWLLLCLCCLCGCGGGKRAAILCVKEARPAGEAVCAQDRSLSYALAGSDRAALQQLDGGQCDYALITSEGAKELESAQQVTLASFVILSRTGGYAEWDKNTRVIIAGEQGDYGDQLAQQVLTCALYGTVRYMERDEALKALKNDRADVVMGLMAPVDEQVEAVLRRFKDLELLSMPESLVSVRLPDESMQEYTLNTGGSSARSYALMGALVIASGAEEETAAQVRRALEKAGLTQANEAAAILE